ncbi:MAG: HD domain-containing protein [Desulfobacterales bacterium]|jgi:HD superfamily phosphodiesterase|nr:phosphohydrolase [Desulfobacter sp.]MDP6395326.1 HD domain-containing protein [Desulfobacterales bacterium]MDP6682732.1 HD domain-containing protein [Desulfobacterales bacterium]MDP6808069.1 HD domain-containing protein [Desulfobacterales bacterium]|tara:strand:- start:30101 stop:30841 length:741 start_codon:yes stop_codon:yes gene_type:complete
MKCPGQDSRYWKPGAIFEEKCPKCGHVVEFFKDDTSRKCEKCAHRFVNPKMDFGCASYCEYADQCLGTLPPELLAQKEDLLKDRVAVEMKRYFKSDFMRIGHATRVARYAERIGKQEGGNLAAILAAAYLHDIGIHEAERKHGSSEAKYQEEEGPPIARSIMTRLGAKEELIEEVCDIIGHHHHPRADETTNFKAVYDSDLIVNLEERQKENLLDEANLSNVIEKSFLTENGRKEAKKVFNIEEAQ